MCDNERVDFVSVSEFADNQFRARIDRGAMALGQVVENGDTVAEVEQLLDAHTADVPGAAGDENAPPFSGQWKNR